MRSFEVGALRALAVMTCCGALGCSGGEGPGPSDEIDLALAEAAGALTQTSITVGADTYVRSGQPNTVFGTDTSLAVGVNGVTRPLLRFDTASIAAAIAPASSVSAAVLSLTLLSNGTAAGTTQTLELHRLTQPWTEAGATWSCAIDSVPANGTQDCSGATLWNMGTPISAPTPPWAASATATTVLAANQLGVVQLDVTADVNAILSGAAENNGWILFRTLSTTGALVRFRSREAVSPPQLALTFVPGLVCGPGQHDGGDGTCVAVGACAAGLGDCDGDGTCERSLATATDCGGCGVSCNDGNACTTDTCGPALACVHGTAPDGTSCNDGDPCTDPDACQSGRCAGALPLACGQAGGGQSPPSGPPPEGCPQQACCSAVPTTEPSLIVTMAQSPGVLARFQLFDVLSTIIARSGVSNMTPLLMLQRWWDSQNTTAGGAFATATHCDASGSTINGYPVTCPRPEGAMAFVNDPFTQFFANSRNPDFFVPVALVNRFDLAAADGSTCGEYRVIYAKQSGMQTATNRLFLNFEAALPNPNPGCGLSGCADVAAFWAGLSSITDQAALADALESFYFDGLPGFLPVIDPRNYGMTGDSAAFCGAPRGQIRTNQFMAGNLAQIRWQLREFHLDRACSGGAYGLSVKPVADSNNPYGDLFAPGAVLPLSGAFQADFLQQVAGLGASTVPGIHMSSPPIYNAGQSEAQGTENEYRQKLGGGNTAFAQSINGEITKVFGSAVLTAQNIVDRATTQSCGGCHHLSNSKALGGGLVWPASLGFSHVDELGRVSPALSQVFLPHRKDVLTSFLACEGLPGGSGSLGACAVH